MTIPKTISDLLWTTYDHVWSNQKNSASVRSIIRNLCLDLGDMRLSDVPATFGLNYTDTLRLQGRAPGTVNRYLSALKRAFRHATDYGWMAKAPTIRAVKEAPPRDRTVADSEVLSLIYAAGTTTPGARLIRFLAETGCRVGEALRLTKDDVSVCGGQVTFTDTKNGETRTIGLTRAARDMLSSDTFAIFPLSPSGFRRAWTAAKAKIGKTHDKTLVPHALRHTVATKLVGQGVPLALVAQYLGHKSIATTMRYTHLNSNHQAPVLEALEA